MSEEKRKNEVSDKPKTNPAEPPKDNLPQQSIPILAATARSPLLTDSDGNGAAPASSSFIDTVYQQINSVLGGDNPNQFLCITIPGQALSAEDFTYDYKNNAPKGPVVEANESRLANKLFDPSRMTGADNGLTLPYQYRTALDMLTPKLNSKIAEAKNQLRRLLMTEYPYDFGDGSDKKYTLQEVFFRLYDDYVEEAENWTDIQNKKKEALRNLYNGNDAASNEQYNDAYLEWYETVAESYLNVINEKMSKVISVFTPNDMKILEGILDSGSGAELQEARQTLNNTQKLTPDGGYVYPVKFNPTNWFELLDTSFTPFDLLKTPDVLAMQLQTLSSKRLKLSSRISEISSMIPEDSAITKAKTDMGDAQKVLDKAKSDLTGVYGDGIKTMLDTLFDVAPLFADGAVPGDIIAKLAQGITFKDGQTIKGLISDINEATKKATDAQQQYANAAQALANASVSVIESKNLESLKNILPPLKEQLEELDTQIKDIQTQLQLSTLTRPAPDTDGKVTDANTSENEVAPPTVPEGYTQVVITADASALDNSTSSDASSSVSTSGASFFFCGYHSEKSSSSSNFSSFTNQQDTSIQIGMNVSKVGIEREWFNPGVFALTKDMFNVTTSKIAPSETYDSMTDSRLNAMRNTIFPCYPTAMVIARDISIKLVSQSSISSEFSSSIESHASTGGGFLFFSGASSSSSSSSSSGVHARSTDNTVTLKFDTPQIIGYYLEATAADKSSYLDDTSSDAQAGFVTISKFVEDYRKMLEDLNKKEN